MSGWRRVELASCAGLPPLQPKAVRHDIRPGGCSRAVTVVRPSTWMGLVMQHANRRAARRLSVSSQLGEASVSSQLGDMSVSSRCLHLRPALQGVPELHPANLSRRALSVFVFVRGSDLCCRFECLAGRFVACRRVLPSSALRALPASSQRRQKESVLKNSCHHFTNVKYNMMPAKFKPEVLKKALSARFRGALLFAATRLNCWPRSRRFSQEVPCSKAPVDDAGLA